MGAYNDLMTFLEKDEHVEAVVFGQWGWDGFGEPDPPPFPHKFFGKALTLAAAKPWMEGWYFDGGYGHPKCYAVNIWTSKRVIWVTQYDRSTRLDSAPRNPIDAMPYMPGS